MVYLTLEFVLKLYRYNLVQKEEKEKRGEKSLHEYVFGNNKI